MQKLLRVSRRRTGVNLMITVLIVMVGIGILTIKAQKLNHQQSIGQNAERQNIGRLKDKQALTNSSRYLAATNQDSTPSTVFSNPAPITINDASPGAPYPSTINVFGLAGAIPPTAGSVKVTIRNYSHTMSDDVGIVLVGPTGAALLLQDGASDGPISNITYTLSDTGATYLPNLTAFIADTYKPTAYYSDDIFPIPGPGTNYGNPGPQNSGTATFSSIFGGTVPNGNWSLYVADFAGGDQGAISGGWSIEITTGVNPPNSRAAFDYDGDGRADISVFRPSANTWFLNQSTQGFAATQFGAGNDLIAPADYDGDGKTDLAVFRPASGTWYRLNSQTNTVSGAQFGSAGDAPRPGDYDGDGRADLVVYRASNNVWYRLNSSNNQVVTTQFGASGDVPAAADYDGDTKADIAVFRPSNGVWYRLNSSDNGFVTVQFGQSGDITTPADYDGDGKTDLAVFRPSNNVWYRLNSNSNNTLSAVQFGSSGDVPAAADYDGDARADIAVFRPSTGTWYRLNSNGGAFVTTQFGQTGDVAVPSAYNQQ